MSPEKQRIAIAKACGYSKFGTRTYSDYGDTEITAYLNGEFCDVPDYLGDLNAMHEAEKVLDYEQCEVFSNTVADIVHRANREKDYPFPWCFARIHATAAEKCEAFLRTLGLWEEEANTAKSASPKSPTTEESSAVQPLPLYVCKTCDHEWDNDRWYCVACNTPYRIPNPARNDEPNRLSCPTQPNQ